MKLLLPFISAIAAAILVYLFGAFAGATFDITTWDSLNRVFCAFVMVIASGMAFAETSHRTNKP